MAKQQPIVWPGKRDASDRLRLRRWLGRLAGVFLTLYFLVVASAVGAMLYDAFTAPPLPGQTVSGQRSQALGEAALAVLGGLVPGLLLLGLMAVLRLDRGFTVRIDTDRRRCVVRRTRYGWTTARREVDLRSADWEVRPALRRRALPERVTVADGCLAVVLVVLGPIGWIVVLVRWLSRSRQGPVLEEAVVEEVVRLELRDDAALQAVVDTEDEATATAFLEAWDGLVR